MTIKVYSSLLPGAALETHEHVGTLAAWLDSKELPWRDWDPQPLQATVNGEPLPVTEWEGRALSGGDAVALMILPHGGVFDAIGSLLGKVFQLAFGWLMPGSRAPTSSQSQQGQQIETASATANQAKLGQVVPELLGRYRRFPDYLNQPRRRFESEREQVLEFLCCVGPGVYAFGDDPVKAGDTPFSALGENASYQIFQPGEDVSGHSAHENWYNVSAVGGTSSGTAGLELSAEIAADINPPAGNYTFDGPTIGLDPAVGSIPESWGVGTTMDIILLRPYTVTRTGMDLPDDPYINTFAGNFRDLMPISVGATVEYGFGGAGVACRVSSVSLDASGDGTMRLERYSDGEWRPVGSVAPGAQNMRFFVANRMWRVTSLSEQQFTVEAIAPNGSVVPDWQGWGPITTSSVTFNVNSSTVYGEWSSWFRACPDSERTTRAELDFFFSEGLAYTNDDASLSAVTVGVQVQWRDGAGVEGGGQVVFQYSRATPDQIGFTEAMNLASMLPEFRVRRVGALNTDQRVRDTVQWYGLRTLLPGRTVYPNWTTMAVRLRTGGKLAAQSENQINLIATRRLPQLNPDNTWTEPQATQQISAAFRHIANTMGYDDSGIDIDELQRLHGIWYGRGDTFDYVFDETTVKEALATVLEAGFAELTIEDGRLLPVRDEPRTVWEQGYSLHNMTGSLKRQFEAPKPDDYDGVEVEYIDSSTWAKDVVPCRLPGDQGFKVLSVKLSGVTDRTRAWRIGMRRRRELRYRRWNYSFQTELDAMNSRYLSYVPLFDDIPGYGKACLLVGISDAGGGVARLRVSEPLEWEQGEQHIVGYRMPDGRLAGPFPAEQGDDDFEILAALPQPWPAPTLKMETPHIYFGTSKRWTFPALITELRPQGMPDTPRVSVTAVNYSPHVYEDDDNQPE